MIFILCQERKWWCFLLSSIFTFLMGILSVLLQRAIASIFCRKVRFSARRQSAKLNWKNPRKNLLHKYLIVRSLIKARLSYRKFYHCLMFYGLLVITYFDVLCNVKPWLLWLSLKCYKIDFSHVICNMKNINFVLFLKNWHHSMLRIMFIQ